MEEDYAEWLEEAEKKIEHYEEAIDQIREEAQVGLLPHAMQDKALEAVLLAINELEKKLS
jgi:uncharacterized protein YjgD (DUF1641 family)